MTNPIRIGLVTPAWPGHDTPNGITTSVFHLAQGLRDIGHPHVVLSRFIDGEMPNGIPFVQIALPPWGLMDRGLSKFSRAHIDKVNRRKRIVALKEAIQKTQADQKLDLIIIEETQGWAGEIIPHVSVPVVICLHGPWLIHKHLQSWGSEAEDQAREAAEKKAFLAAAGLLSPSQNVLAAIEDAYDLGDVPRQVIANSYGPPAGQVTSYDGPILFIGRYDLHKGGDTVLAAFDALAQTDARARLSFVGPDRGLLHSDGTRTTLDSEVAAMSPDARARLSILGQRDSTEIMEMRNTHPIALIASRYENMNYTLLEAMGAGQAIVSTNVGGPAEVLKDGETALLVPPDDPGAMAKALKRLLDDPALAARLGQAARAEVESTFHPNTIAAETVAFCRTVIAHSTQS